MYLERVNSPADLKKLDMRELELYAGEVREYIIKVVSKNGGHLSSNLGAVDFTIALHYVFDCPEDKIVFDVGHQSYAHKIITGRRDAFETLRTPGGLTGFENMRESECDAFSTGHSSTSLSVGLGLARARDLTGGHYNVVSVIGDGALTGGMAYEALNDIGASGTRMIIILNDNNMSISKNVGAISAYLGRLRLSRRYKSLKTTFKTGIDGVPLVGPSLVKVVERAKSFVKKQLPITNKLFEQFGIKYYGAFDGHNIREVVRMLMQLKTRNHPAILHLVTNKGSGLYEAEKDPEKYHGVEGAHRAAHKYSDVVGGTLTELAGNDKKVVAVSAAMLPGTGLTAMKEAFPDRCFDVGIAEQHAAALCAGMAAGGAKPYFAVYSTFLQRAYDQLVHDVCLNKLPVRFLVDRAGAVGADGATHQGLFDIPYLSSLPNMTVMTPSCGEELAAMMRWSLSFDGPLAIRYPKEYVTDRSVPPVEYGKWTVAEEGRSDVYILAPGSRMLDLSCGSGATVVNVRFIKPLDTAFLDEINRAGNLVITVEDGMLRGGFGESVLAYYGEKKRCELVRLGFADKFCGNLSVEGALAENGLTSENLEKIIAAHDKNSKILE